MIVDYDFESIPVNPTYHDRLPRVALVPGTYRDYLKAVEEGVAASLDATTAPGWSASPSCARA